MSEILGALFKYLVALLGASAVVAVFYLTLAQNKVQNAISDLVQLQVNIETLFSGQADYASLATSTAVRAKLAPPSMISGTTLITPWGGNVTVAVDGTTTTLYTISVAGVPQEACAKIALALGHSSTANKCNITGSKASADISVPFSAASVAEACDATTNTVVVQFKR